MISVVRCILSLICTLLVTPFLSVAASAYQLSGAGAVSGLSLSPTGDSFVVAEVTGNRTIGGGTLTIVDFRTGTHSNIPLTNGIIPFNPEFLPTGESVVFSGFCSLEGECAEAVDGWNLFQAEIATGDIRRLTKPSLGVVRWQSVHAAGGGFYVTEFSDLGGSPYELQYSVATSIVKIDNEGHEVWRFPRSPNQGPYHPFGHYTSVELIREHGSGLQFLAAIKPSAVLASKFADLDQFDVRMTEFLIREIHQPELDTGVKRHVWKTLYSLDSKSLGFLVDEGGLDGLIPAAEEVGVPWIANASASTEEIYAVTFHWTEFGGRIIRLNGAEISELARTYFWGQDSLRFFDVQGDRAIVVSKNSNGQEKLILFKNWVPVSRSE